MNGKTEIVLAGVGGQGLVTIGAILGEAAVLEGRNACLSSSYGTEARGTFTKSDVIISDDEIDFIEAEEPAAVLCLAQAAYDRYSPVLGPEAVLIYDSDRVTPSGKGASRETGYSLSALADPGTANLAALGLVTALSGAVREESVAEVLRKKTASSSPLRKGSEEAFRKGFAAASL